MANRLMESYKQKKKALRRKRRKESQERQLPYESKIECEITKRTIQKWNKETHSYDEIERITAIVAYALNTKDPIEAFPIRVARAKRTKRGLKFTAIICPYCGKLAFYDKAWDCFICYNHSDRKIIELCPKHNVIPNVVETPTQ